MRFALFLILCVAAVFAADSKSGRLHTIEKVIFYRYYQLETLLGDGNDRKFAPGCEGCDDKENGFKKFVEHVINIEKEAVDFKEPSFDLKELRKQVNSLFTSSKTKTVASAQFNNLKIMPSIPEDAEFKYDKLYRETMEWTKTTKARIEDLEGDKRVEAKKLWDSSETALQEMKNMRKAGFLNSQVQDAKADSNIGGKLSQYEKKIPPELNGGQANYKEIDWAKLRKSSKDAEFLSALNDWVETRNNRDTVTKQHIAADTLVEDLQKCY